MLPGRHGFIAGGNIPPCRFVKVGATDGLVVEATAVADRCIGISQEGSRNVPALGLSTTNAAETGDPVKVFGIGDQCLLEISASVAYGARLGATAGDGRGVTAAAGSPAFARALQAGGAAGQKILVEIIGEDTIGAS